ncbi:hypothetical protein EMIT0P291_150022 [Pseudomonas sp. IT-P291]
MQGMRSASQPSGSKLPRHKGTGPTIFSGVKIERSSDGGLLPSQLPADINTAATLGRCSARAPFLLTLQGLSRIATSIPVGNLHGGRRW